MVILAGTITTGDASLLQHCVKVVLAFKLCVTVQDVAAPYKFVYKEASTPLVPEVPANPDVPEVPAPPVGPVGPKAPPPELIAAYPDTDTGNVTTKLVVFVNVIDAGIICVLSAFKIHVTLTYWIPNPCVIDQVVFGEA